MNNYYKDKLFKIQKKIIYIESKLYDKKFNYINNKFNVKIFKKYSNLLKIRNILTTINEYKVELNKLKILKYDKDLFDLVYEERNILKIKINNLINKLNKYDCNSDNKVSSLYLEIYSGTGGEEAAFFVYDLFRMYIKYCEKMNWKVDLISSNSITCKSYKYIILKISGKSAYNYLKFESGGHRVQRVPKTETQGRIHTSTCIVAVMPIAPKLLAPIIKNEDIKIDTFRSSGAGGQHVNTTDSAVRITHLSTGIVVECQKERSQHKNKFKALEVLKARIYSWELQKRKKEINIKKRNLLGTGLRSNRSRTYNFIKNRVTDHRINYSIYCLDKILNGNLNLLIKFLLKK